MNKYKNMKERGCTCCLGEESWTLGIGGLEGGGEEVPCNALFGAELGPFPLFTLELFFSVTIIGFGGVCWGFGAPWRWRAISSWRFWRRRRGSEESTRYKLNSSISFSGV